ncbi:MAG: hypothetical protein K5754_11620 [Butyrivibrio sp.]|nr:hypothetical protein [Butyrivibrio sp.]
MKYTIKDIKRAIENILDELYPHPENLIAEFSTIEDIANQIVFELIKEDYKKNADRNTIQFYMDKYDVDATNRKYTRAIQYAQHYRNIDFDLIQADFGIELEDLKPQDVSGEKVFKGHRYTEQDFLGFKMQAECRLLNKLHQRQIEFSKSISESKFKELFIEYRNLLYDLEPLVNNPEDVICKTLLFYGLESYFLIDFLYALCVAAEANGYPKIIPLERIQAVCSTIPVILEKHWCPEVFFADYCMLLKWDSMAKHIYEDDEEHWLRNECIIYDCKQLKNIVLQRGLDNWVDLVKECSVNDKANFIIENYWIWDKIIDYEWTSERIQYYRKLHSELMRIFPKPQIK